MKGILSVLFLSLCLFTGSSFSRTATAEPWEAPFDTSGNASKPADSVLSFAEVLNLVADRNPTLRALMLQRQASEGKVKQAGLLPNPEIGIEVEEVGWDAPGFKESEFTVSLAQDLELFGQRRARTKVARAEKEALEWETKLSAFDLYLETKRRFYVLVHAQQRLALSETSVALAQGIVENINFRIEKGAALQSELLLAQLEKQRAQMMLQEAHQEVAAARVALAALWRGNPNGFTVSAKPEPNLSDVLGKLGRLEAGIDSTRDLLLLERQLALLRAEHSLAVAESRPTITLNGGYRRLEATNSNSLLFGVSLPLPLFNRNQGTRMSLAAQAQSLSYEKERARLEADASLKSGITKLHQLVQRHTTLDTLLLPTAEEAYHTFQKAYQAGRIPYVQLLEAERALNELRFEHNDMLLEIYEQTIALESLTGVTLRLGKE